jgi:hypothetical protein
MRVTKSTRLLPHDRPLEEYLSIGAFLGGELKNVIANDPRVYLCILLLIAIFLEDNREVFPWPVTDCAGCLDFAASHKHLSSMEEPRGLPPDDPASPFPTEFMDLDPMEQTEQERVLKSVIDDIQLYIPMWEAFAGSHVHHKTRAFNTECSAPKVHKSGIDTGILEKIKKAMDSVFDKYAIKEHLRMQVKGWLSHAVYITTRVYICILDCLSNSYSSNRLGPKWSEKT